MGGLVLFHWEKCGTGQDPACCYYNLWVERNQQKCAQVHIYPNAGFKTTGLFWNGDWYGPAEPEWGPALKANSFLGAPVLFPTPNRVRTQTFRLEGKQYEMIKNGCRRGQHGIAFDSVWEHSDPAIESDAILLTGTLEILPGCDNYLAFPFPCRLTVTYRLTMKGLGFYYQVENTGDSDMPYGIGLHPCFTLQNAHEPVLLTIPAQALYEVTPDLLPTGRLLALDACKGYEVDQGRDVKTFRLDNGFLLKDGDTLLRYPERNTQLCIRTTPEFTVSVLYTPVALGQLPASEHPIFFLEHQTCCTDAINLHEAGVQNTGLLILKPGERNEGSIHYIFEEMTQ